MYSAVHFIQYSLTAGFSLIKYKFVFFRDLSTIFTEPLPGIFAAPEEDNLFKVHCLIIGPFDTPYEGGFFHFLVRFGPQYPLHPPRVRLLTTGADTVRFNPNLYKNGKVCLSILG